jgi:hypothetical protein
MPSLSWLISVFAARIVCVEAILLEIGEAFLVSRRGPHFFFICLTDLIFSFDPSPRNDLTYTRPPDGLHPTEKGKRETNKARERKD